MGRCPLLRRPLSVAPNVHHHAHFCQQQDQTGAAGREKRQADAGIRDGVGDHGDVAEHLPGDLRHNANSHHGAELVLGLIGDHQALRYEQYAQHDDEHRTDEAQFFAHHTEDEVVGAFRQPELLFHAVAKAKALQPAGADGVQALLGLVVQRFQIIGPCIQAVLQIANGFHQRQGRFQQQSRRCGPAPCQYTAAAGQHEDGAHDGGGQQDAGHVRL